MEKQNHINTFNTFLFKKKKKKKKKVLSGARFLGIMQKRLLWYYANSESLDQIVPPDDIAHPLGPSTKLLVRAGGIQTSGYTVWMSSWSGSLLFLYFVSF